MPKHSSSPSVPSSTSRPAWRKAPVAPSRQCRSPRRGRTGAWRAVSPDGRTRPWIRYRSECEMPGRGRLYRGERLLAWHWRVLGAGARWVRDVRTRTVERRSMGAGGPGALDLIAPEAPGGCDRLPPGRLRSTIARESQMGHLETASRTKIFQGLRRRPREGIPGFFNLKFEAPIAWKVPPNLTAPCGRLSAYLNYTLCRVIYRIMQIRRATQLEAIQYRSRPDGRCKLHDML
jgi:hypothetical protein